MITRPNNFVLYRNKHRNSKEITKFLHSQDIRERPPRKKTAGRQEAGSMESTGRQQAYTREATERQHGSDRDSMETAQAAG